MTSPFPELAAPVFPAYLHGIVSRSPADEIAAMLGDGAGLRHIRSQIERIGPHFRLALITGEGGSGKQQVARCLHLASPGTGGPFVVADATRLEHALLAGAEGLAAASAATPDLDDLVESSRGGTLFLAEIGKLSLPGQAALLNLLDRQARNHGLRDARIIASASRSLRAMAAAGAFRQDLLYRISTVEIAVPALRERRGDIPGLAQHFLRTFSRLYNKPVQGLTRDTLDRLCRHEWPGNVRELEEVIRGAVLDCDAASLDLRHLPALERPAAPGSHLSPSGSRSVRLQDVVEEHVLEILRRCDGNKLRAAELLGISRSTLYRMLDSAAAARQP